MKILYFFSWPTSQTTKTECDNQRMVCYTTSSFTFHSSTAERPDQVGFDNTFVAIYYCALSSVLHGWAPRKSVLGPRGQFTSSWAKRRGIPDLEKYQYYYSIYINFPIYIIIYTVSICLSLKIMSLYRFNISFHISQKFKSKQPLKKKKLRLLFYTNVSAYVYWYKSTTIFSLAS